MYRIAFSTFCLALASAAASAGPTTSAPREMAQATQAPPTANAATTTAAPAERKICKQLPSSYSHATQRVCLTKDEWKQVDEQMKD